MQLSALSAYILCNIHVYMRENAYIKDLYAWRILIFLCIYLGEEGGWGWCTNVYVWEHKVSLYYRIAFFADIYEPW